MARHNLTHDHSRLTAAARRRYERSFDRASDAFDRDWDGEAYERAVRNAKHQLRADLDYAERPDAYCPDTYAAAGELLPRRDCARCIAS